MSWSGSDTLDNYPSLDGPLSARYDPDLGSKGRPKPRRGGFGDAGTMGVNGELPVAPVVTVASERQLADELAAAAAGLDMSQSWEQRVLAMLRIEGLVKGGAATAPSFADLLPSLQIPLTEQLQDRRSAISRQACHLLSTLVQAVGPRAEPLAAALLPVVFKAQGMSIQVVTEASDACCRTLIQYCPSSRYLPILCSTIRTSKSPKMRTAAAEYLAQAVREWDLGPLDKQVEAVEASIMAAAGDSAAETREIGREMFVAYASRKPAAAAAMLRRLPDTERSLKEKLEKAVKRQLGDAVVNVSVAHSRKPSASSTGSQSPRRPGPPARVPRLAISALPSPRAAGPLSARAPAPVAPSAALPPRPASAAASPARRSIFASSTTATETSSLSARGPRKSMGGAALRVPPLGLPLSPEAPPRPAPALSAPKRVLPSPTATRTAREESPAPAREAPSLHHSTLSPSVNERTKAAARVILMEPERAAMSLGDAVAALARPGLAWDAKINLFGDLQSAIESAPSLPADEDPYEFEAKFTGLLAEGLGDPHFKVVSAALETLTAALHCPLLTPALDAHLDRLCPVLFLKLTDAKKQVRQVAGGAADRLPAVLPPEAVTRGLAAALASSKAPKVMCAAMDFFADMNIASTRRGAEIADSGPLRVMVERCVPLAVHKHPDVRQSALGALAGVYFAGDAGSEVVRCSIDALPPGSGEAVKRGIASIGGGAELVREMTPMRSPSPSPMRSPSPVPMRSPSPAAMAAARRRESITMSADTVAAAVDLLMPRDPTPQPMAISPSPPPAPAAAVRTPTPPPSVGPRPGPDSLGPSPSPLAPLVVEVPEGDATGKDDDVVKSNGSGGTPKTVSITVDATGLVQCTQPWSTAPVAADTHDLEAVLAGLHPLPTEAALIEAHTLAARLAGAERQILCDCVQSAVLAALEKGVDAEIAEVSMRIFAEVVALMTPEALEVATPALLRPLALAQSHPSEGTAFAAEKLGKALIAKLPPVAALSMLAPLLPRADRRPPFEGERAAQSLGVLRLLRLSLPKLSNVQVSGVLSTIVPPMCVCYTSANAELRRAAVDCIVDLHLKLGAAALAPHTSLLSSAQVKLIEIYVERAQRGRPPADVLAF